MATAIPLKVECDEHGTYHVNVPPDARIDATPLVAQQHGRCFALISFSSSKTKLLGPLRIDVYDPKELERIQMLAGSQNGRVNWIRGLNALADAFPDSPVCEFFSAPQPLPDPLPRVEPFEPKLLPEALRPWIFDIAERM
jgi:hypothetical protein